MSKQTEIAWASGFFDGEGYVGLQWKRRAANTNRWWILHVNVTNTDKAALERFVLAVGVGRIYARRPIPNRRPTFALQATDKVAERIIRTIRPYSLTKAQVIDLAIEARSLGQRKPWVPIPEEKWRRTMIIESEIKQLNGRDHRDKTVREADRQSAFVENRLSHTSQ